MANDDHLLEQALNRINAWMLGLMVAGTAGAAFLGGWRALVGFFLGAAVAYFHFRWIRQMVDALAPGAPPPRKRILALLVLRYAIFGGLAYVLVKTVGISLPAALAGLSVSVAAVMAEALWELVYSRS